MNLLSKYLNRRRQAKIDREELEHRRAMQKMERTAKAIEVADIVARCVVEASERIMAAQEPRRFPPGGIIHPEVPIGKYEEFAVPRRTPRPYRNGTYELPTPKEYAHG